MDEAIVIRMREEEADLVRKLDAVRQFLAAYGGPAPVAAAAKGSTVTRRSSATRADKFGSYGQGVIDAACKLLEGANAPVPTRDLLAKLERYGVEVRGENKVNALSALLARSSKVQGHGRAGWTLAGDPPTAEEIQETLGEQAQNETKAPNGDAASASVVAKSGAPTPGPAAWINPQPGWTS
jgi:hypothetical protein